MGQNTEAAALPLRLPGGEGPFHGGLNTNTQRSAAIFFFIFFCLASTHMGCFPFCQTKSCRCASLILHLFCMTAVAAAGSVFSSLKIQSDDCSSFLTDFAVLSLLWEQQLALHKTTAPLIYCYASENCTAGDM